MWALAVGMSLMGGFVNWYGRVKAGHTRAFNMIELVGEVVVSGFVGLGAFMVAAGMGFDAGICAAAAGVAGHMGTRLLFLLERYTKKRFNAMMKGMK